MKNRRLSLPDRTAKPRTAGLTVVIDNGIPVNAFADAVSSSPELVDLVKFGWGTALVTARLEEKIGVLRELGIGYFFGGTLFEKYLSQGLLPEYFALCRKHGCEWIEVSNGTIQLSNHDKSRFVRRAAGHFNVLSEVGYKDADRSVTLNGEDWAACIAADFAAGATYVVTEARESGKSGICDSSGALRFDVVEDIISGGFDLDRLVFEAPTKDLQTFFVTRVGSNVNLANIAPCDVIGVETLRLGLRSDTLVHFELERQHVHGEVAIGA